MGFFRGDGNQLGNELLEGGAAIVVEGARKADGFARREWAEASVEVVIVAVDQLQGDDAGIRELADELLGVDIATDAVAGDQRVAAVEGIPRSFKISPLRQPLDVEGVGCEPSGANRFFPLPLLVAEVRKDRP